MQRWTGDISFAGVTSYSVFNSQVRRTMRVIPIVSVMLFALFGCDLSGHPDGPGSDTHFGQCRLLEPARVAPDSVRSDTGVFQSSAYLPFTKAALVDGLTLVANDAVPDSFISLVEKVIVEMFAQGEFTDTVRQVELLNNLYIYNAVIPVINYANMDRFLADSESQINALALENSICDIIMYGSDGQVMEVVEHILHYVSVIGLSYTFADEWGISRSSELYRSMQVAIDKGYYDVTSYEQDGLDEETYLRVTMQEFGYWVISTAWNLQEPYGHGEGEWSIKDRKDLEQKLPELYEALVSTVDKVMMAPSVETLQKIDSL
ncbi:MAG: hypothetical protein OIF34_07800 [Porticoccaceae bacterium]|nr:hypothetical protein [Porticoccaceae bacterium]